MTSDALDASACSVAIRTSFLPLSSASSLLGPPIRVERPAASTIAATWRLPSISGLARGCGRVTISIKSPPTPRPISSARVTFSPANRRISTQSNPFSTGERAQPGAPSTGTPPALPINRRLPGSTGVSEGTTAPVSNRGGAEHDNKLRAKAEQFLDRPRQRRFLMRHAAFGDDGSACRRQPLRRDAQRLFDHLRRQSRQQGG